MIRTLTKEQDDFLHEIYLESFEEDFKRWITLMEEDYLNNRLI